MSRRSTKKITKKELDKWEKEVQEALDNGDVFPNAKEALTINSIIEEYSETFKTLSDYDNQEIRTFESGATRNSDAGKFDYDGFISYPVMVSFAEYMHKHRIQSDGTLRDSDNWQKGIPKDAYMKSMWRHFMSVWANHRGYDTDEDMITSLCALLFNVQGYLHEELKSYGKRPTKT